VLICLESPLYWVHKYLIVVAVDRHLEALRETSNWDVRHVVALIEAPVETHEETSYCFGRPSLVEADPVVGRAVSLLEFGVRTD
jgi:hypothetical protein